MSIFGIAAQTFKSSYAAAAQPATATKVIGLTKAVQAGETVVAVNVTGAAKAFPKAAKSAAPTVAKAVGTHLAITALGLEVIDLVENSLDKSKRRRELNMLVSQAAREGLTDDINSRMAVLTRADEHRTFSQWVSDLPFRTLRRVTRLCLVEAGWWYTVLTLPISATAFALDLVYTFGLVPLYRQFAEAFGHTVEVKERMPSRFFQWLIAKTWGVGMRVFTKGAEIRLHNRSVTKADTLLYPVLEKASISAQEKIPAIVDRHTAFAWGEAFAEAIGAQGLERAEVLRAYAQAPYWVEDHLEPHVYHGVLGGVRTGTPRMYRDLTTATSISE